MRCYICDVELLEDEIYIDSKTEKFAPCSVCNEAIREDLKEDEPDG